MYKLIMEYLDQGYEISFTPGRRNNTIRLSKHGCNILRNIDAYYANWSEVQVNQFLSIMKDDLDAKLREEDLI